MGVYDNICVLQISTLTGKCAAKLGELSQSLFGLSPELSVEEAVEENVAGAVEDQEEVAEDPHDPGPNRERSGKKIAE